MKTPEEMAEEYAAKEGKPWGCEQYFLAGYQAAKYECEVKIKELKDTLAGMEDEHEGLKTIIYDNEQTNLPTPAKWISVKDRLPEIPENDYSNSVLLLRADRFIVIARIEKCVRFVRPFQEALIVETDNGDPIEEFTHWMELPAPPKEEK
jgi:hypothetical protein